MSAKQPTLKDISMPSTSPLSLQRPRDPRSGSAASYLRSIADGDLTAPQAITQTLSNALAANDYSNCIEDLPGINIDPQAYIDSLDRVRPRLLYPRLLPLTPLGDSRL